MRNVLVVAPKGNAEMVAAALRTIFAQPDAEHVRMQLDVIATMLGKQLPKVAEMLREAADEITAFAVFRAGQSSGSTWRSAAAPTSSGYSPARKRCSDSPAQCWSRPTTSGKSPPTAVMPDPPSDATHATFHATRRPEAQCITVSAKGRAPQSSGSYPRFGASHRSASRSVYPLRAA